MVTLWLGCKVKLEGISKFIFSSRFLLDLRSAIRNLKKNMDPLELKVTVVS
jgi:hypothetical protein